jgi:hypothetical protein
MRSTESSGLDQVRELIAHHARPADSPAEHGLVNDRVKMEGRVAMKQFLPPEPRLPLPFAGGE